VNREVGVVVESRGRAPILNYRREALIPRVAIRPLARRGSTCTRHNSGGFAALSFSAQAVGDHFSR
jgi:hypothetical protein